MTDGVAPIRRCHIVAMSPAVDRNDLEAVICLSEQYDELRRLHDLADVPLIHKADVWPDHTRDATQRRVVLFAECLRLGRRVGFVKAGIQGWRIRILSRRP